MKGYRYEDNSSKLHKTAASGVRVGFAFCPSPFIQKRCQYKLLKTHGRSSASKA